MSLDWPVDPFARSEFPDLRCLLKFPAANNNKVLFQPPLVPVGDRVFFTHSRRYSNVLQGGMGAVPSFPNDCIVLPGTPGALLDLFSPDRGTENPNSVTSKNYWT